jgi:hypothetical protein
MIPRSLAPGLGNGRAGCEEHGMGGFLRLGALLGMLLLTACYPPVLPQKISEVKPLETTYDQVIATFGLPSSEVNLTGGSKIVVYNLPEFERNLFQQTPFLNLVESNYDRSAFDFFIFDHDGVLQSFSIPHFARLAGIPDPGT